MVYRVFVEKKKGLDNEAQSVYGELKNLLGIKGLDGVRIFNRYDVENLSESQFGQAVKTVFSEPQLDDFYYELPKINGKVFAVTAKGEYSLRMRLYEAEERFRGSSFVRISNSEMINLKTVRSFDLSLAGTICVSLKNWEKAYVSRRYVSRIKEALGM